MPEIEICRHPLCRHLRRDHAGPERLGRCTVFLCPCGFFSLREFAGGRGESLSLTDARLRVLDAIDAVQWQPFLGGTKHNTFAAMRALFANDDDACARLVPRMSATREEKEGDEMAKQPQQPQPQGGQQPPQGQQQGGQQAQQGRQGQGAQGFDLGGLSKLLQDLGPLGAAAYAVIQDLLQVLHPQAQAAQAAPKVACEPACRHCDQAIKLQVQAIANMLCCRHCCSEDQG